MPDFTDTQRLVLATAVQRPDRLVLPLPDHLKGGAASRVLDALAGRGLTEEVEARPGDPVWRETGDGHGVTLVATDAALAALGIETEPSVTETDPEVEAAVAAIEATLPQPKSRRADSKQAHLIGMLKRPDGASIEEIVGAFGWQAHTVRGAIAGALKKKLGLTVTTEKIEGRGRVYRIAS